MWPFKEKEKEEICYDMSEYKVGMLVKLMSGGPVMTISKIFTNGLDCCWFNDSSQKYCVLLVYDPAVLYKVKDGLTGARAWAVDETIKK